MFSKPNLPANSICMDTVKAKIIELLPDEDIAYYEAWQAGEPRRITIADVLRAIDKEYETGFAVYQGGQIWMNGKYTMLVWNLALSYDGQTQEVKDFIGKLLGV